MNVFILIDKAPLIFVIILLDEHIAVMESLKGVHVDGAVLVTTPQVF